MTKLEKLLGELQTEMQDAADQVEEEARPSAAGDYKRGIGHGYRKAAELLGRAYLQGRFRDVDR